MPLFVLDTTVGVVVVQTDDDAHALDVLKRYKVQNPGHHVVLAADEVVPAPKMEGRKHS